MKKLILSLLCFASTSVFAGNIAVDAWNFQVNGHEYIWMEKKNEAGEKVIAANVIHDPECSFCKAKKRTIEIEFPVLFVDEQNKPVKTAVPSSK